MAKELPYIRHDDGMVEINTARRGIVHAFDTEAEAEAWLAARAK